MENVSDPAWWFTALFVGIVASVLAAFAKDWIQQWLSRYSEKAKVKQLERVEKRSQIINALAENEALLVMVMIRAGFGLVIMIGSMIIFLVSPGYVFALSSLCGLGEEHLVCSDLKLAKTVLMVIPVLSGITAAIVSFLAIRLLRTAMAGYGRYRRKKGFPKLY